MSRTAVCFFALIASASALSSTLPVRRGRQRPPSIVLALPAAVQAANSWEQGTYLDQEVEDNWDALQVFKREQKEIDYLIALH